MSCCNLLQVSPNSLSGQFFGNIDYISFDFKSIIHSLSNPRWFRPTSSKPSNDAILSHSKLLSKRLLSSTFNIMVIDFNNFDTLEKINIDSLYHSLHNFAELHNISVVFAVNTYKVHMQGFNGIFDLWGFDEIVANVFIKNMNSKPIGLEFETYRINHLTSI
ncbi:hypothetical protein EN12_20600 [Vibrio cholerae]|nr:hypothetical protein EN12_20600 [Vibrio cholerae]